MNRPLVIALSVLVGIYCLPLLWSLLLTLVAIVMGIIGVIFSVIFFILFKVIPLLLLGYLLWWLIRDNHEYRSH